MIGSLLIANRGEIAVRIMRTCRRLGIHTIAVYSDADRDALHVAVADEAIRIGPSAARDSYLRPDAIMQAAACVGADGIHPGYGFLSEKPDLARLCVEQGRVFVGPSADRIAAMGPKIGSKVIADRAGVPSVPGYLGEDQSTQRLADGAERIGFPLMVKASAGGGGKGMRRVFGRADLAAAIDLARQEAEAAFGDPSLLIEKLVMRPRHLEVQVAGDKHGNVVHLFERDCSVQRNNQKVLEEAPAPNLDPAIRAKLLERGVALARAINYDNLGTVEFILEDGSSDPWFLEMNTRLQVEHPVTEVITGFDLVEWQIRIASGERVPALQSDIHESGHAIEARITAERADQDFRPDAGRIVGYSAPPNLRIDSGVQAGSEVTLFYDSLLAKAIASGETREIARTRLAAGLRDYSVLGPATTIPFLIDAVEHPIFSSGRATTSFIADAFPDGWKPVRPQARLARAAAALLMLDALPVNVQTPSAWTRLSGFRVLGPAGGLSETRLLAIEEGKTFVLAVKARPDGERRVLDEEGEIALKVRSNGNSVEVEADERILRGVFERTNGRVRLTLAGETCDIGLEAEVALLAGAASGSGGSGAVLATMPGVVAEVRVSAGETVDAGQVMVVLESMKLFSSLKAEIAGVVADVACKPGETVMAGKRLVLVEPQAGT
ncbi:MULTISPECIES: biotin carboxylase N-terminal domain-containing protein [Bradyrhizobium]|jgi:3-methylcrotonyl-CoA carboxylase alpha subunit|uniref:3-methylcrotonyl-CoA carboxylase alpha subunit n=2 Tax=Bradyrhizobium TaxID=374 RepID=A0ABY0P9N8_9BRAD|nr:MULTISPECIES: biotin carboxylase N-terminal domain-containing protein [Bradyrhizobium]SDH74784.1 3-methylcrotonyl-CoA carboxylase alpha subunit [Bradyrhizobium ottawaense]SEE09952.1 3-methylcrotonyl-CoA carboxylase alpha subunit [Bradyrhizobium lablabi]SHM05704.1 3-methylcrotonyl-CoA carboxylase alpha subunit [Bradyrhizobium lablabi]